MKLNTKGLRKEILKRTDKYGCPKTIREKTKYGWNKNARY
jgi:hypothetical protein